MTDNLPPEGETPDSGEAARDQTQSDAFKKWFGESKVVDEAGKPRVQYHGTFAAFNTFDNARSLDVGHHFGTTEQASNFGDRQIAAYLSIKNPLRLQSDAGSDPRSFQIALAQAGVSHPEIYAAWQEFNHATKGRPFAYKTRDAKAYFDSVKSTLQKLDYDGIVYPNEVEGPGDSWIAFHPEQIKSATGNTGTFDPDNPDIRFAKGGPVQRFDALAGTLAGLSRTLTQPGGLFQQRQALSLDALATAPALGQQGSGKAAPALEDTVRRHTLDILALRADVSELRQRGDRTPRQPVQRQAFEGGGRVDGPGSETDDAIPAKLSKGEFVLSAADVRAAGGTGAVEAWREGLRGEKGYAAGGPVAADWEQFTTKAGKPAWRNPLSGAALYQEEKPAVAPEQHKTGQRWLDISEGAQYAAADLLPDLAREERHKALVKMVGAQPGANVSVGSHAPRAGQEMLSFGISHPKIAAQQRTLRESADGGLVMDNDAFFLKRGQKKGGFGLQVFRDQVEALANLGAERIDTIAGKGGGMIGYYAWPRMGYNADLDDYTKGSLPEDLSGAKTVLDLMATPEGREWWKKHGDQMPMSFDLTPGSRSLNTLNEYLGEKGMEPVRVDAEQVEQRKLQRWQIHRDIGAHEGLGGARSMWLDWVRDFTPERGSPTLDRVEGMARDTLRHYGASGETWESGAGVRGAAHPRNYWSRQAAYQFGRAFERNGFPMLVKPPAETLTVPGAGAEPSRFATGGAVRQRYDAGGSVFGPGTETSDSIPARLSRDEFVLSAADVRAAGGPAKVEEWRHTLHFAAGGPVEREPAESLRGAMADGREWGAGGDGGGGRADELLGELIREIKGMREEMKGMKGREQTGSTAPSNIFPYTPLTGGKW